MSEHTTSNDAVGLDFDSEAGVATLTLQMAGRANKIDDAFGEGLTEGLAWAKEQEGLNGILIASAHKDWCVGADIDGLYNQRDTAAMVEHVQGLQQLYRSIETCGVPVVALLTGSALGGGYELAMACHRRIALDSARVQVGLPEVSLGVMPGAGGTQRLPRMIGAQAALQIILQGRTLRAPKALKQGLVDELGSDAEEMRAKALAWIAANPKARQPWDKKGFRVKPTPGGEDARNLYMVSAAMLYKKTAGVFEGPNTALSVVQQGLRLTFDRALELETRAFARLACGDQAKDMIRTIWYHRTAAAKHQGLPSVEDAGIAKVGILGAGMMGAGLAFVSAQKGYEVVLKDIHQEALDAAMKHCQEQGARLRHLSEAAQGEILGRIQYTLADADLAGCDLVIEAVVENTAVKHQVTRAIEPLMAEGGIWASNTSAIPITDLAEASAQPDRFIGLHFFSPVEKMQLLEIVMGEQTSEDTLARCLNYCKRICKLPIVVNDGYGFFTSRVFSAYILEGAQLVAEGHNPVLVDRAARLAGMVVGPLQVFDEVTLSLGKHALEQAEQYLGPVDLPGVALVRRMVDELDRPGKAAGRGFYDYGDDGRRIWPGLRELASGVPDETGVAILAGRLMLVQCAEVARAMDEGILRQRRDAEVGAVFGIGFAPGSGGPLSLLDRIGLSAAVAAMDSLAERYGERYRPAAGLRAMAEKGEPYWD